MWMSPRPAPKKSTLFALPHFSWAHTTCPLMMLKSSSHTVPHCPECSSSTRPAQRSCPPTNLTIWCSGGQTPNQITIKAKTKVRRLSKHLWEDLRWLTANYFSCICAVAFCSCIAVQFWVVQGAVCKTSAIVHCCSLADVKNVATTKMFTDLDWIFICLGEDHVDCSVLVKSPECARAAIGQT